MKYKLNKNGIERLQRFKRDIESGNYKLKTELFRGNFIYYRVESSKSVTCVFDYDESKVKDDVIEQINKTLTGEIYTGKHDNGTKYYAVDGGCGLYFNEVEEVK